MARKKKPCEFCEGDWDTNQDEVNGHQLCVEVYPENNFIGITSFALDEVGDTTELTADIPLNYCPNCGRKLDF